MPNSLKNKLKKLALTKKIILGSSAVAIISVFLPWYSDIDRFKIGDTFLGINGPLYLAGLLMLVAAAISCGIIVLQLMEKPLPKLPLAENKLHIFNGGISIFMLVLAASVYFHSKFGVNLTDKNAGIGMVLGFISSGGLILGGFLGMKTREINFEEEGHVEPLITIENREKRDISPDKEVTVEEATKAWDQVQESINNYRSSEGDTKDIR